MSVAGSQRALGEPTGEAPRLERLGRGVVRELLRRPGGVIPLTLLALTLVTAIAGPRFAPHNPNSIDVTRTLAAPSGRHLLGTDELGRDNLSRLIYGTRIALEIAIPSVLGAFVIGTMLGLVAGYLGGVIDKVLVVLFDAVISFPAVILGLALLTLIGPSVTSVIFVIGLALVPYYGRLVRAQTASERRNQYIKAERSLGASHMRVLTSHILPNVLPTMLIIVAMDIPGAIAIEAGLAFLGIGVQPPTADWGVMLNDGFTDIGTSPWGILGPVIALVIVTTTFTVLGETLRDIIDPKYHVSRRSRLRPRLDSEPQS